MGKKGDEASAMAQESPSLSAGRFCLTLQKVVVSMKRDLIVTFTLDGIEKVSNVDKNFTEEINDVHLWERDIPLLDDSVLVIKIVSKEKLMKNKLVGECVYSLRSIAMASTAQSAEVKTSVKDASGKQTDNFLQFKLDYVKPNLDPDEAAAGGGAAALTDVEKTKISKKEAAKLKSSTTSAQRRALLDRANLPTKPQDFQIRVFVHEARNLFGGNLHPVTNVNIGKMGKHTRVQRSTAKPKWEECLIYDFNMSPAELVDMPILIEVLNSKKMRSDCLVGSFKFDVGEVYVYSDHTFWHKWILLTDPDDKESGVKGYVLVSISILGPGDKIKSPPKLSNADEIDMESNVLQPAGVQLQPCTYTIRVYKAEDLPEMDSDAFDGVKRAFGMQHEGIDKVDPYVVVSFAGKKLKTNVIYNSYSPVWNQELNMGIQIPTMCEQLMLKVMDKDHLNRDDVVATSFLHLTRLSSEDTDDEGFLPTFGPAFVCFYGSPREFRNMSMDLGGLDKGLGEGCSFRGRLLVQLTVTQGRYPNHDEYIKPIDHDDLYACQQFQRRRKYRTFVGFLEGCMINPVDGPIEFEVTMGDYGNKYSVGHAAMASPSTTQPQNAVYDGQSYYYMPWRDVKPCVMLISHWEDNTFRIESLNFLLKIIDTLEQNIKTVGLMIRSEAPIEDSARSLMALLDNLIDDLNKDLLDLPTNYTNLDEKMYRLRYDDMRTISDEAKELRENAVDLEAALEEIENYKSRLNTIAVEPQNSIPDLIIWMLVGGRREAYIRIPSHEIMYSNGEDAIGMKCGKTSTYLLKKPCMTDRINHKSNWLLPAKLQLFIWMGLDDAAKSIQHRPYDGEISVFAETYENMVFVPPGWTTKMMTRPKWSDSTGKLKLPKYCFETPSGWLWDDDWFIKPQVTSTDTDSSIMTFQDDVYETVTRLPGGNWTSGEVTWETNLGEEHVAKEAIMPPNGWEWNDSWQVDLSRAVDEVGFEYCLDHTVTGYVPVEKTYHLHRRRRWVRNRKRNPDIRQRAVQEKIREEAKEGWEYARLWGSKFHFKQRKIDLVRRRLWLRKMVTSNPDAEPIFTFTEDLHLSNENLDQTGQKAGQIPAFYSPRMYITYRESHKYQLRAYLYQARDLISEDASGLSDPYAKIIYGNQSKATKIIPETLCPTWDQTIILDGIEIWGCPEEVSQHPPSVVLELFDYDPVGHDFLGRSVVNPMVVIFAEDAMTCRLNWYPIQRGPNPGGEILAAFELYLNDEDDNILPSLPPMMDETYQVAAAIAPEMQHTRIEILTWGVRNMKKFQLSAINNPSIEIECGGVVKSTNKIKNAKKNPNFDTSSLFFDVYLPIEELYMPPLNIRLLDHRTFGLKPLVGTHTIQSLKDYRRDPVAQYQAIRDKMLIDGFGGTDSEYEMERGRESPDGGFSNASTYKSLLDSASKTFKGASDTVKGGTGTSTGTRKSVYSWFSNGDGESDEDSDSAWEPPFFGDDEEDQLVDDLDWWSKYYASIGDENLGRVYNEKGYESMEYFEELELRFGNFKDLAESYPIWHGKHDELQPELDRAVGHFKGTFRIYPLPADGSEPPPRMLQNAPSNETIELKVRVYVIKAKDLQPQDPNGFSDPYPAVKLGKTKIRDRDNYKPKCLEPMFGLVYELDCTIPLESELKVQIFDYDYMSGDDLIGETKIDLENRYLSTHRGICGLPKRYYTAGPFKWRDCQTPKEILEEWCSTQVLSPPMWSGNCRVKVAGVLYLLSDYEVKGKVHKDWGPADERLALYVLLDNKLVPEHIEQRTLYNPLRPEISQGVIELFVDIFPKSREIPGPINITPRAPQDLELRVIIWNCSDVVLSDISMTGELMSDIYVKGWLKGQDKKQRTDVHYRSLNGEGNFNWRLIFPFKYLPAEEVMVIKKKEHFYSIDKHEEKHPAIFCVQIWDNDIFHADDFLGVLELNLNKMPKPAKFAKTVSLDDLIDNDKGKEVQVISLFDQKNIKGWWPCYCDYDPSIPRELTGKIEMEVEILTKEDAETKPAGKARDEPNENPKLKPPDRPATSFSWFSSPWKSMRYILWANYKWYIIGGLLILLVIAFVLIFLYSLPGGVADMLMAKF